MGCEMKGIKKITALFLIMILTISTSGFVNKVESAQVSKSQTNDSPISMGVSAHAYVVMDANSGEIIMSQDADKKIYPASTTKLLTAVVAIENCNLDREIEVKQAALNKVDVESSIVGLRAGSTYTMEQLLYMLLIVSAGDAAEVIAEEVAGSSEAFATMMNEKAKALKLKNTHFTNCTGLHDINHYTCAKDLSTMAAYLLQIGGTKLLSVTSLYDSYVREKTKQKFWLVNTNKLLKQYPGVDGLKTGFTKEAGYCIVTTCKKKDLRLIGVVMNEDKPQTRNEDMKGLLNFGFSKYQQVKLYNKGEIIDTVKVKDMVEQKINVVSHKNLYYLYEKTNQKKLKKKIVYGSLQLPIDQKRSIGKLILCNNGKAVATYPLYSEKNVKKMSFLDKLLRVYQSLI